MKRKLSMVLSLMLSVMVAGCSGNAPVQETTPAPTEQTAEKETLSLGLISSISALPILMAEEEGYFDEMGVDVTLEFFKAAQDRDAALQAGQIDGVICDQIAIAIYQSAGIDMKITGMTDGEFVLVGGANSGVNEVTDLAGKKVAISENTIIEYTLDQLLDKYNVPRDQVEKVSIPSMPTRLEMLNNGEIDAALMPSPFSDTALASGGKMIEKVDVDSGMYASVTAFKQSVIDEKPNAVKAFYEAYNKGVDYINNTDVKAYEDVIITTVGYPEEMRGNIIAPVFRKNQLPSLELVENVFTWSKEKGLLTIELAPSDAVSDIGVIQ